ncbi:helix-turn-helix domain-containing protein [Leptospira santarosai]|uniref:helix-turn-helix domain-containing protein n=1 Tax=Leptospira santarosai TaxID=28183 RepID=UPI0026E1E5F1|nr:helix-turn-helix transcriptional regulator [Leptospira santarosai]
MSSKKNQSVDQIIAKWHDCLEAEELDKQILTDYIREFVGSKRGNQALLARESGIDPVVITHLLNGTQNPSFERILRLSKTVQKLIKY